MQAPKVSSALAGALSITAGSGADGGVKKLDSRTLPGDRGGAGTYKLREGEDYQLGATKIFIKEPKNLFAIEYMRSLALGAVVSRVAYVGRFPSTRIIGVTMLRCAVLCGAATPAAVPMLASSWPGLGRLLMSVHIRYERQPLLLS